MNLKSKKLLAAAIAISALGVLSCGTELTDNAGPVELVVTNTQTLRILDVGPNDDPDCDKNIGTINMQVLQKRPLPPGTPTTFSQVRVTRYRVSYRRTDGGSLVPNPFVRSIDTLVGVGQTAGSNFTILELDVFQRAPFASLQPQNGGRDPETGRTFVKLEVIVEVFGETLAGENVYDATTFPLDFCYGCGCSS
jgi:hypothetical protein